MRKEPVRNLDVIGKGGLCCKGLYKYQFLQPLACCTSSRCHFHCLIYKTQPWNFFGKKQFSSTSDVLFQVNQGRNNSLVDREEGEADLLLIEIIYFFLESK